MQCTCRNQWCQQSFEITPSDLALYEKVSPIFNGKKELIPPPTLCPECRQQRRAAFRNERTFYHRTCALTGEPLITMYAPESPYTVYGVDAWWSDRWDPLSFGQPFDPSRSFFEQLQTLRSRVPRPALFAKANENSPYTNHCDHAKNCYLCADVGFGEDIFFSKYVIRAKDCMDCYMTNNSELCYETLYTEGYRCIATRQCEEVSDSTFLYDCKSCHHCCLSWNLRGKSYCIENVQYTEAEYGERVRALRLDSFSGFERTRRRFEEVILRAIHQPSLLVHCEDSSGAALHHCKSVTDSYDVGNARDCAHCYLSDGLQDCYDTYESAFDCELQYEGYACNRGKRILSCAISYDVSDVAYCDICHNSKNLFGCVGLRHHQYCILNRQYTKEEYESLGAKIIDHMRKTPLRSPDGSSAGYEYGEFFPMSLSPFAYNETTAQEYFPLTKEQVLERGWEWKEEADDMPKVTRIIPADQLPDAIDDIPDDILNWAIRCDATKRPFKIIRQELAFYRNMRLPVPHLHPDERHRRRMLLRHRCRLYRRPCAKCGQKMETTYAPEKPEIVYCESCYLSSVY
ncbi:MAG: hypothetical protein V1926_00325 [Candidatus Peregrinibacteria bacterium]